MSKKFEDIHPTHYSFQQIMDSPSVSEEFIKHLKKTANYDQYDFLLNTLEYKRLLSKKNKKKKAEEIAEHFLKEGSKGEINIPGRVRKTVLDNIKSLKESELTDTLFKDSEESVLYDLALDVFPRFIFDDDFSDFMKKEFEKLGYEKFQETYLLNQEDIKQQETTKERYNIRGVSIPKVKEITDQKFTNFINFSNEEIQSIDSSKVFLSENHINEVLNEMFKPSSGIPLHVNKGLFKSSTNTKRREFLGLEAIKWLKRYLIVDDIKPIDLFLNLLIEKKVIASTSQKKSKFSEKEVYYYTFKKKVVIVGGGFGGIWVAKTLQNDFDVTLISERDHHQYIIGFYKLFVDPSQINKLETPIIKLADKIKIIKARVDTISPTGVYYNNQKLPFDYLVVGTGSRYVTTFPIHIEPTSKEFAQDEMQEIKDNSEKALVLMCSSSQEILSSFAQIRYASNIVIIGGGPAALEVAGEIALHKKDTQITLMTQAGTLLERRPPHIQKSAYKIISSFPNIKVLFNKRVTRVYNDKVYYKQSSTLDDKEQYLTSTVVIVCVGFRPNTNIFRQFMSSSLTDRGFVKVSKYFQVKKNVNKLKPEELIEKTVENIQNESSKLFSVSENIDDEKVTNEVDKKDLFQGIKEISEDYVTDTSFKFDQNEEYPNIFAIGDIIESTEEKLAKFAIDHGKLVGKNIKEYEYSGTMTPYSFGKYELESIYAIGNSGMYLKGDKILAKGEYVLKLKEMIENMIKNFN